VASVLGLRSGIGLVVANMVGAGVFLSTGFMSQSLTPGLVLLNWLVGGILALCGARAYAEVARLVPDGGGEYRYLSRLLHPALGYVAGWASLLVGFSAPIAVDALAAAAFARAAAPTLVGAPTTLALVLIVGLTGLHAVGMNVSARVQNGLVALKILLLVGFVGVGLVKGAWSTPVWSPPEAPTLDGFMGSLFFVAFAYSGWNAAIYAADEFRNPARDVPRAMLWGCGAVLALYLVVNVIFVVNLTPTEGQVVFGYSSFTSGQSQAEAVTLGQAVMRQLLGSGAAQLMSGVMVLLFVSAMSAMIFIGPRVTAAMAKDGVLPTVFRGRDGKAPVWGLLLQGAVASLAVVTQELRSVLETVGAVLVLFAALTVLGLFRAKARLGVTPARSALLAAGIYVIASGWMLYVGFHRSVLAVACRLGIGIDGCATLGPRDSPTLVVSVVVVFAVALIAYGITQRVRRATAVV
jgi:basic amino acid/polyamine antiporter, APA family